MKIDINGKFFFKISCPDGKTYNSSVYENLITDNGLDFFIKRLYLDSEEVGYIKSFGYGIGEEDEELDEDGNVLPTATSISGQHNTSDLVVTQSANSLRLTADITVLPDVDEQNKHQSINLCDRLGVLTNNGILISYAKHNPIEAPEGAIITITYVYEINAI